ncbi:MAG: trypsin-like peptidase domain-containing protein [Chitinophagaceae bacterium]
MEMIPAYSNYKILVVALLFSFGVCKSQNKDTLSKYSYWMTGYKEMDSSFLFNVATCFFVRNNNNLYLVTSNHVISGCDESQNKKLHPDIAQIWIEDSTGHPAEVITVNVTYERDTSKCYDFTEVADVMVLKMPAKGYEKINSVEKFLQPPFKKINQLIIFGYPASGVDYKIASKLKIKNNPKVVTHFALFNNKNDTIPKIDSINYNVVTNSIPINNTLKGYSGSPVFLQDKTTKRWRIAGVFSGALTATNTGYLSVAKIDYVLKQIEKLNVK